jgi:hypothetical protein
MKHILSFLLFTLFLSITSCSVAQKYGIVKAHAYYRQTVAGTIPVDEKGNPTDNGVRRQYFIYVESGKQEHPKWQQVYINGTPYSVKAVEVTEEKVKLGRLRNAEKEITINRKSGNKLFQLQLTPTQQEPASTEKVDSIQISGTWRNKPFTYKITPVQQLARINYE